jgi:membrane associated rhomboid family serine protease
MNLIRRRFTYRFHNITLYLIGVNLVVFVLQQVFPILSSYLALNAYNVSRFHAYWQFISYMFAHGSIPHILFNMLALFIFGIPVERQMGSREFLLYYMLTGILAGVFSFVLYLFSGSFGVFLLGASGSIFAVQLAYAILFPNTRLYIWGILPLRAPVMVIGFTLVELASQVLGFNSGVAHLTHLAGFGFGWIYFLLRFGINPIKVWRHK